MTEKIGFRSTHYTVTTFSKIVVICTLLAAFLLWLLAPDGAYTFRFPFDLDLKTDISGATDTLAAIFGFSISIAGAFVAIALANRANELSEETSRISRYQNDLAFQANMLMKKQNDIAIKQTQMEAMNYVENLTAGRIANRGRVVSAADAVVASAEDLALSLNAAIDKSMESTANKDNWSPNISLITDGEVLAARHKISMAFREMSEALRAVPADGECLTKEVSRLLASLCKDDRSLKDPFEFSDYYAPTSGNFRSAEESLAARLKPTGLANRFHRWSRKVLDDELIYERLLESSFAAPAYKSSRVRVDLKRPRVSFGEFAASMPRLSWVNSHPDLAVFKVMILFGSPISVPMVPNRLRSKNLQADAMGTIFTTEGVLALALLKACVPSLDPIAKSAIEELNRVFGTHKTETLNLDETTDWATSILERHLEHKLSGQTSTYRLDVLHSDANSSPYSLLFTYPASPLNSGFRLENFGGMLNRVDDSIGDFFRQSD